MAWLVLTVGTCGGTQQLIGNLIGNAVCDTLGRMKKACFVLVGPDRLLRLGVEQSDHSNPRVLRVEASLQPVEGLNSMMVQVVQQMRAEPPQQGIPLHERAIKITDTGAAEQLNFPMLGKAVIEPDGAKMGDHPHVLKIILRPMKLSQAEQLVGRREIPQSEYGARGEPMDGFQIDP